ncbi:MAG TPA: hypothetical protein VKT49_19645 [Bryobacteraceae bacterium]|nr:hypothetical protein [Bryobacteraceae bacterium]
MIRDCRAGRGQGWRFFISSYVPVMRRLTAHYLGEAAVRGDREVQVLRALCRPESSLFSSLDPAPERWFVAELRQQVLAALDPQPGEPAAGHVDLDTLGQALQPLTLLEKQATWLETMRYTHAHAGVLLRMDPRTVEKIRERAAERLRGRMDEWRRTLLADEGRQLGRAAAAIRTGDCLPAKAFLDVLDGRTTWSGRETLERHVTDCWHCIDHFCRLAEVLDVLRGLAPLSEAETEALCQALGIGAARAGGWRRWFHRP